MEPGKVREIQERADLLVFMAHLLRQYAKEHHPQELRSEYYKTAQAVGRSAKILDWRTKNHTYTRAENL